MAIYHFSLKTIGRASGKSAVASAAYISGTRLYSQETGLTYNYRKKKEIVFRHIFLPKDAPGEYKDRETLWNAVQKIEKRSDARLARMIDVALPREFDRDLQIHILRKYVKDQFVSKGMCADVAIHDKGDGNPHAHIMLTTRGFNPDGSWRKKEKSVYKLDASGNKIPLIDPETGLQKVRVRKGKGTEKLWQRESVPSNDWNKRENVETWRGAWSDICNHYLDQSQRIDHRSYKRQGLDLEPTIHEGYAARQMEEKGLVSERAEYNRGVKERNRLRQEIRRKVEELYQNIMEKAREIYGRIKGYLGLDEKGGSPSEPVGRRRKAVIAVTEGKRKVAFTERGIDRAEQDITGTEEFFEKIFEGITKAEQFIDRTDRSLRRSEQNLQETEQKIRGTESELDSIKQRIDQQREENDRRFKTIMEKHRTIMEGDCYDEEFDKRNRAYSFGGRISEQTYEAERNYTKTGGEDHSVGENDRCPKDRDRSREISESPAEDHDRYKRRDDRSERPGNRGVKEEPSMRIAFAKPPEQRKKKAVHKKTKKEIGLRL